jgi:hypothetical protein
MFKQVLRTDRYVHIQSSSDYRSVTTRQFNRAKTQHLRGGKIRKPVKVWIDGKMFIFKLNHWVKASILASDYHRFCKGLPYLYRWEQRNRFKKQVPLKRYGNSYR